MYNNHQKETINRFFCQISFLKRAEIEKKKNPLIWREWSLKEKKVIKRVCFDWHLPNARVNDLSVGENLQKEKWIGPMSECVLQIVCLKDRERERVCVFVWIVLVWVKEREWMGECMFVCVRVRVCVCVCVSQIVCVSYYLKSAWELPFSKTTLSLSQDKLHTNCTVNKDWCIWDFEKLYWVWYIP